MMDDDGPRVHATARTETDGGWITFAVKCKLPQTPPESEVFNFKARKNIIPDHERP